MAKYFFKRAAMLMALATVVIASGCNQNVGQRREMVPPCLTGTTTVAVTEIELNKGELPLKVGESKKLVATVMPANATNKQVTWASDKPAVATVSQDGTVTAKEECTAQITVKTVNGGKTANCKIIVTAKDSTPTAEFTVEMTHGEHGTISANPAIPASGKIAKDTSITFTAKADTGFSVDTWTITGGEILDGTGTEGSLTAKVKITANTKVNVTFKALSPGEFSVGMTADEHGTISADPDIIGGKAVKDSVITFTALPEKGYEVDKWSITTDSALIDGGTGISKTAKVKITTNTTVTVSFKKISYKVMFDAKGGLPVPPAQHVLYKEKASVPTVPAKEGYDLEGWFNKDGDVLWDFTVDEVTKDTELYAKWKAKTDTAYTVQHLQQNISDDKYTVIDTENKTGTTDTMTVAAAKNYLGFTAQAVTQQTIKGDGTTIVQIKYDRNEITLTLDLNDLNISNPHVIKKVKGRYGAPVTVAEPTCHGYKFIGWSPALPATFPETDSSHTAQWKYVH